MPKTTLKQSRAYGVRLGRILSNLGMARVVLNEAVAVAGPDLITEFPGLKKLAEITATKEQLAWQMLEKKR